MGVTNMLRSRLPARETGSRTVAPGEPVTADGNAELHGPTAARPLNWYLDQAMVFEEGKTAAALASARTAWRCVGGAMAVSFISVVFGASSFYLNKPEAPLVLEPLPKGEVRVLTQLTDAKMTFKDATDKHYLREYVKYRESYDWETIQTNYDYTIAHSDERVGDQYKAIQNPDKKDSPVKVYKDWFRVIAEVGTINFVGKTAIVSFSTRTVRVKGTPQESDKQEPEYFTATVTRRYEDGPMSEEERRVNPPGYKTTSYDVVPDLSRQSEARRAAAQAHATQQPPQGTLQ